MEEFNEHMTQLMNKKPEQLSEDERIILLSYLKNNGLNYKTYLPSVKIPKTFKTKNTEKEKKDILQKIEIITEKVLSLEEKCISFVEIEVQGNKKHVMALNDEEYEQVCKEIEKCYADIHALSKLK